MGWGGDVPYDRIILVAMTFRERKKEVKEKIEKVSFFPPGRLERGEYCLAGPPAALRGRRCGCGGEPEEVPKLAGAWKWLTAP